MNMMSNKHILPNNKNYELKYTIEFTQNKKVFEDMEKSNFDYSRLNKKQFDNLNEAIYLNTSLHYNDTVLYVSCYQELIIDGITVQEDYITNMPIIDTKEYYKASECKEVLQHEISRRNIFLNKYNISENHYMAS